MLIDQYILVLNNLKYSMFDNRKLLICELVLMYAILFGPQPVKTNADHVLRGGDNTTLIRGVSVDRQYATYATHQSISSNSFTFSQYDFNRSIFYDLYSNLTCQVKGLQQVRNFNNLTTNKFMISHPINSSLYSSNFTIFNKSWVPNWNTNYEFLFGASGSFIYEATANQTNVNLTQRNFSAMTITRNFQYPSQKFISLGFYTSRILLLTYSPSNNSQIILRIYDNTNMTLNWTFHLGVTNTSESIRMSATSTYIGISVGRNFRILSCAANFSHLWNLTINQQISDIQIAGNKYAIVATNTSILQYNISNCFLMSVLTSPKPSPQLNMGLFNGSYWLTVWKVDQTYVDFYMLTNSYDCLGCYNCTCTAGYCFDSMFQRCEWVGIGVSCTNDFNLSNCVYPTPPVPIPFQITIPTQQLSICLQGDILSQCNRYCSQNCNRCYVSTGKCESCISFYKINGDGICQISTLNLVLFTLSSVLNIFRYRQFQRVYFVVDDFKFHIYHKTNYTGIFKTIIEFSNILQKDFWSLIKQHHFLNWIFSSWPISTYSAYTNPKFQQIERNDSFFLQNTKDFITVYIPLIIIMFCLFNRLFYLLFQYKISILFRVFSFWYNIILFIVVQNATMLTFLACRHFTHMFSFDYFTRILQGLTVGLIGFILLMAFSFFFNCQYLYGKSSKNFLCNMSKDNQSFILMSKYFIARPIIQTVVHAYFYNSPELQLLFVSIIQFISILILLKTELFYNLFKIKGQFICDCVLDFSLSFLNFMLCLQYYKYPELSVLFQTWITNLIYFNACIMILNIIYSLLNIAFDNKKTTKVKKRVRQFLSQMQKDPIVMTKMMLSPKQPNLKISALLMQPYDQNQNYNTLQH